MSPDLSFRPCLRGAGANEGASGRCAGAEASDAAGGSRASRGVAGVGRVSVRGAAAGPAAPGLAAASGRAVGAAAPRSGRRDPQMPSGAAAAETQRDPGPSARGPGLEEAGRGGGESGAPPAEVRDGGAGRGEAWGGGGARGGGARAPGWEDPSPGGWSGAGAATVKGARRGNGSGKRGNAGDSRLDPPPRELKGRSGGRPRRIWREGELSGNHWDRAVIPKDLAYSVGIDREDLRKARKAKCR